MLFESLRYQTSPENSRSNVRQAVFSNIRIWERLDGSIFSLIPTGNVGAAWSYDLKVTVFSPPIAPGVCLTPQEEALDDVRVLLSYVLDIELHPDIDACRFLSVDRVVRDLNRLIPKRFDVANGLDKTKAAPPLATLEHLIVTPDAHLLVVLRAARAYERSMQALGREQRDLAYVLLVFALECLAKMRSAPAQISWKQYPPGQRDAVDRIIRRCAVPEDAAEKIRETLTSARHLRVTENFREFILESLDDGFYKAAPQTLGKLGPIRRLRRSLTPRLLSQAYDARSGFAHALDPIAEAVSAHAEDEYCYLRAGEMALTFRGLHRVFREVMASVMAKRGMPAESVAPPDMPGVIHLEWSYEYWIYQRFPKSNGADARFWLARLLDLHVRFCVRGGNPKPAQPIPVAAIGAHAAHAAPDKTYRPAMLALASICGHRPDQEPKKTIETLAAQVFLNGTCGESVHKAAGILETHFRLGTPGFDPPPFIEIVLSVAIARGFHMVGDRGEFRRWLEIARDDAVDDPLLQERLAAAAVDDVPIEPNTLLFPRGNPGQLLYGFASTTTSTTG